MSRYAVISDIHGNLFAFRAALARMAGLDIDEVICVGDVVGYGPHPSECLDLAVKYCRHIVQGNHDQAVVDPVCANGFNGAAREAIHWTREILGPLHLNALVQMPVTARIDSPAGPILCIHDCPVKGPTNYVHDKQVAAMAFDGLESAICLLGHTHVPMVFEAPAVHPDEGLTSCEVTAYIPGHEVEIVLEPDRRYICNPGSIGQPRDCDPRASFAVLDTDARTFTVHRQEYDVAAAQSAALQAGLPTVLANRLAVGA